MLSQSNDYSKEESVKAKLSRLWGKVMTTDFLVGIFEKENKTTASVHYESVLRKLAKDLAKQQNFVLHYGNVPANSSHQTKGTLSEFWWEFIRYTFPFASLYLEPSDFLIG